MRILHTSDWHIDRSFNRARLLDMQVNLLDWLCDFVADEGVDAVVIAGDIYDQQSPSVSAVEALDHVLSRLAAQNVAVIGISGNHDSAIRVSFLEKVVSTAGIAIRGDLRKVGEPIIVPETHGESTGASAVAFYPIPYIEPHIARHVLQSPELTSHDALLKLALNRAQSDLQSRITAGNKLRSMAIVHAFVTGGAPSDSERELSVGGSSEVGLGLFKGFDYGALGHLHGRQSFGDGSVRYSGSPMAYSFSETHHVKGGWLIDLPPIGQATVTAVDFPVQRPLAKLNGALEELLTSSAFADHEGSFIQASLTDPIAPQQALEKLRRRFPHTIELQFSSPPTSATQDNFRKQTRGKSDLELATGFLQFVTDHPPTEHALKLFAQTMDEVETDQL